MTGPIDNIEIKLSNININDNKTSNKKKTVNKKENKQLKDKLSKIELFKKLGEYDTLTNQTRFVSKDEFIGEYSELFFKNGGDWCRYSSLNKSIYKFATMKANGREIKLLWKATDIEEKEVEKSFKDNCEIVKGNQIQYFKIFGIKNEQQCCNHPIREDIKEYYKNKACVHCGTNTDLQCDHKNGLYTDSRVLNTKTQTIDDFQSLCRHCNCQKRQVEKKTKKTSIRYGATKIPSLAIFGIDFIEGDETINFEDVNALKGTYWYDPVEFMKYIKLKLTKN
jgi:hypothetical protein